MQIWNVVIILQKSHVKIMVKLDVSVSTIIGTEAVPPAFYLFILDKLERVYPI